MGRREKLVMVGVDTMSNKEFSSVVDQLCQTFEIGYLTDIQTCLLRARESVANNLSNDDYSRYENEWYILSDFVNSFELTELMRLRPGAHIFGVPAFIRHVLHLSTWKKPRPVFNFSMVGAVVCVTGFRDAEVINRLATLVNWMGGSVRRSFSPDTVTHLVAFRRTGEKVENAVLSSNDVAIVKRSWIDCAWDSRTESPMLNATNRDFANLHSADLFQETGFTFVGFAPNSPELNTLRDQVSAKGGYVTDDLLDERLTHVIASNSCSNDTWVLEKLHQLAIIDQKLNPIPEISSSPQSDASAVISPVICTQSFSVDRRGQTYRVPVLCVEWVTLSLEFNYLLPPDAYLFSFQSPSTTKSNTHLTLPPLAVSNFHPVGLKKRCTNLRYRRSLSEADLSRFSLPVKLSPKTLDSCRHRKDIVTPLLINEDFPGSEIGAYENRHTGIPFIAPNSNSKLDVKKNILSETAPKSAQLKPYLKRSPITKLSPRSNSNDKVSFVTSPRHRNNPRGFTSPLLEANRLSGCQSRSTSDKSQLHSSALPTLSQENLLSQLVDPLTIPSNRERLPSHVLSAEQRCNSHQSEDVSSLSTVECDPISRCSSNSLDSSNNKVLLLPSSSSSHQQQQQQQISTPSSGKRKSSSRVSLFHSTARKSRTPGSDVNSSVVIGSNNMVCGNSYLQNESSSDLNSTPLRLRLENRQHRVFEFFVTERNYVEILRYLYREAYTQLIDENQPGGPILPRKEVDYVFGKLGAVCELHERLQPQLTHLETTWSLTDSCLGDVLKSSVLAEMDKAYGNYMQFYSPAHLNHLGEEFPRFAAFMRQVEKRKESGRQNLAALLVRPVQRLPSISLLMEGIAKFTPVGHPDYVAVKQFVEGINDLLTKINDRLRKNEERLSLLSLYHEISGAPPEMLSSSRSLIARLNVFELGTSGSGSTTCEPVTLFLLSDSLEVAKPRKRHTSEPLAHAIRAALAAVQAPGSEQTYDGPRDQSSHAHGAAANLVNMSLLEGKQRCGYKHLQLLKLHDIKRVVNFDTASPDRAAFGLVVRSNSEIDDRIHAYCLAASFAASAAVINGRCPELVESAISSTTNGNASAAATTSSSSFAISQCCSTAALSGACGPGPCGDQSRSNSLPPPSAHKANHVAMLQARVDEVKRVFLHQLCHHICQVSCLVNSPDELLVDVEPEELLGFDLELVFNAAASALCSKRLTRQLTRNISVKTPRRLAASAKRQGTPSNTSSVVNAANDDQVGDICPLPSPRRSMLGSLLGSSCTSLSNFLNTTLRSSNVGLSKALQPPNRSAMTPKPIRRKVSALRQNSFDDLDVGKNVVDIDEEDGDGVGRVTGADSEVMFAHHLSNSILSLTSWESTSTLDNVLHRFDRIPNRTTTNVRSGTNSAIWETVSHLGVSTAEELRHSVRSPSSTNFECYTGVDGFFKKHKKQKKPKLRAVSQLFQRSSVISKTKDNRKLSGDRVSRDILHGLPSEVPLSCRRDSLLRNLFFR